MDSENYPRGAGTAQRLAPHMRSGLLAILAGVLATSLLAGCDQRQVEEGIHKAGAGLVESWNKVKPDSLLFKNIVIGQSTEEQLRRQAGKPESVREDRDGSWWLEYPRSTEGVANWIVRIDPDGRVAEIEQVLTAQNIARIRQGMGQDEVRRILGKPTQIQRFALKNQDVWSWRWQEEPNEKAFFNAHFGPDGRVVATSRNADPKQQH